MAGWAGHLIYLAEAEYKFFEGLPARTASKLIDWHYTLLKIDCTIIG
jgi:hypothetical protein